jgi:hypothetical protein
LQGPSLVNPDGGFIRILDYLIFQRNYWDGRMLTEFDQNTIANMTTALESVCKQIPSGEDSHDLRKRIGNAIIACANSGRRTFIDFQNAGSTVLTELNRSKKFDWFGFGRLFRVK